MNQAAEDSRLHSPMHNSEMQKYERPTTQSTVRLNIEQLGSWEVGTSGQLQVRTSLRIVRRHAQRNSVNVCTPCCVEDDVIHKTGSRYMLHCRQRRTEARPRNIRESLATLELVFEIRKQTTHIHTCRHA